MFYSGESNVPGAPGNLFAGGPSFDINRRPGSVGGRSGEQLKRLYEGGTQQNEKLNEELRQRGIMPRGVDLPFAMGLDASPLIAQAYPGGQAIGNAAALGGQMGVGPQNYEAMMQQLQQMGAQGGGQPPVNFGVDIENEKVKNLRGNVRAQIDKNQSVNFGGQYNVQDQSGRFGVGYQTPTFGFDVNVTRTQPMPGMGGPGGYGAMMNMGGRF